MTSTDAIEGMSADDTVANMFFSAEGLDDPTPLYHHLRSVAPVHDSATGALFLTRFDDCDQVLRDNRFGKATDERSGGLIPQTDEAAIRFRQEQLARMRTERRQVSMLFLDPPHHTRQRRLVSRAFTPRRVEMLRASIAALAERAVDTLVEAGRADLLELVAFPLPVAVIGTMVGVPEADWGQFRSLITAAAAGIEPGAGLEDLKRADTASTEVNEYFADLIAERRRDPHDDLLSDLIAVEEAGDKLNEGEIIAVAALLFAAGFETTTNLIGNGVGALLRNPDEFARLWADPTLIPSAVDEILRWDSPVQIDVRRALEPAEVAGHAVEEGKAVVTLLGAANRDPARFPDPDRFDIARDDGTPMSFASGIHHCLGANLARAEGQEVFRALQARCSAIEADGELVRRGRVTLRGYQAVPVSVTPR
jgi:cytochrome P450